MKSGDGGGTSGGMEARIAKLEDALEGLKFSLTLLASLVGLLMAVTPGGFAFLGVQVNRLDSKIDSKIDGMGTRIDGISRQLAEEFRAMRVETAAQTSAIASSIIAARQVQPRIVVMPPVPLTPSPVPPPAERKPATP